MKPVIYSEDPFWLKSSEKISQEKLEEMRNEINVCEARFSTLCQQLGLKQSKRPKRYLASNLHKVEQQIVENMRV